MAPISSDSTVRGISSTANVDYSAGIGLSEDALIVLAVCSSVTFLTLIALIPLCVCYCRSKRKRGISSSKKTSQKKDVKTSRKKSPTGKLTSHSKQSNDDSEPSIIILNEKDLIISPPEMLEDRAKETTTAPKQVSGGTSSPTAKVPVVSTNAKTPIVSAKTAEVPSVSMVKSASAIAPETKSSVSLSVHDHSSRIIGALKDILDIASTTKKQAILNQSSGRASAKKVSSTKNSANSAGKHSIIVRTTNRK